MIALVESIEEKVINFFRNYGKYIGCGMLVGILTYFMMMASNLVNDLDGIWHLSNFIAGDWEISLGRGLQRYADRARFGIVSDSFNIIVTLFFVVTANAMILRKFDINSTFYKLVIVVILVANPTICHVLSYSYLAINYGLAYFFSVLAFSHINKIEENKKKTLVGIVLSSIFLAISMSFYQAYISVASILVVLFILKLLLERKTLKEMMQYLIASAGTVLLGGALYLFLSKLLLYRAGIPMASYGGAADLNVVLMIKELPASIKECYLQFWNYFYTEKAMSNLEFIDIILLGLFIVYLVSALIQFVKLIKQNKRNAFLFAIMVILLPVVSCFILLIAVGSTMTSLMSMGVIMCIVMLGIIVPKDGKIGFWLKRGYFLFLVMFAWFQLSAVINDQVALKEGKTATITLTENIISQLYDTGYLDEYQSVAFVGRPGNNDRFAQNKAYQIANGYAQFGCWSTDARNNQVSWMGVTSNFLGVNLSICGILEYQEIIKLEKVANMPEFPLKGSICVINDIIVIKVSELY